MLGLLAADRVEALAGSRRRVEAQALEAWHAETPGVLGRHSVDADAVQTVRAGLEERQEARVGLDDLVRYFA